MLNFIELSPDFGIVETAIPREWEGKTLAQLNIRARHRVNIIAVRKGEREMEIAPGGEYVLERGDEVVALGRTEDINRLQEL